MADYDYDLGVIGGGAAGLTVVSGAAQLGARTLLIEKDIELGGDCLHFGCVPSKTLIKSADAYHVMKNAGKFGLPPVDVKPVIYSDISERIRSVIAVIQKHDSRERFCSLGADVKMGNPEFQDEYTVSLNNRKYTAKSWVIATGSSASIPPLEGLSNIPYITNRDVYSLEKLPESMIVLGGGAISLEMAQTFCRFGTEVTVLQRSGQILSRAGRTGTSQSFFSMS